MILVIYLRSRLLFVLFLLLLSGSCLHNSFMHIISYHIVSYQKVRQLLREPRPQVHYKSQPNAKTPRKTQKSTNIKSLNTAARNGVSRVNPADERFLHNFKATLSAG